MNTHVIGVIASVFTAIALLPQLIKIFREKKSDGISYLMLTSLLIGLSMWIWYGINKDDVIIIASNIFALTVNILVVIMSIVYRTKEN
jgi:MtN3 and saliva related transmembrane protein